MENTSKIPLFTDFHSPQQKTEQHPLLKLGAIFTQAAFKPFSTSSDVIVNCDTSNIVVGRHLNSELKS